MKRFVDLLLSFILLLLFLPLMITIAIMIRLKMGSPIFFIQKRPGLYERSFYLFKFRTMHPLYDKNGELLPDHLRLTQLGQFLRKYSLDELPQLLNVLKGDMSLVGPRPLLEEYLPLYTKEQRTRHHTRPGLTGWAQVNGRNAISWEKRFACDKWYVENQSFRLDMKILALTLYKVIKKDGITQSNHATVEKYTGRSEVR